MKLILTDIEDFDFKISDELLKKGDIALKQANE